LRFNICIQHRKSFRPLILQEDVGDYFDQSYPDPFMIKVYNVLPDKHDVIPAVTHVDGTGRLQTVELPLPVGSEFSPAHARGPCPSAGARPGDTGPLGWARLSTGIPIVNVESVGGVSAMMVA
jgi:hypothetical protein